jgi:hypothetical protein
VLIKQGRGKKEEDVEEKREEEEEEIGDEAHYEERKSIKQDQDNVK